MFPIREHLIPDPALGWGYLRFEQERLLPRVHVHSALELILIVRGHGTRIVGDSIEPYGPGDLVLVGSGLPHGYTSMADSETTEAVVIHFVRDFLGPRFFDLPPFADIPEMLDRSARGLRFPRVPADLNALDEFAPAERTLSLVGILVDLSRQKSTALASGQGAIQVSTPSATRLEDMVEIVNQRYAEPISAKDVAAAAFMHPSAASRLFARLTGTSITRYLNMVRIDAACRLLRDTDLAIAVIAGECGFGNLSNFNRVFRELKLSTPREYRARLRSGLPAATTRS